MSSWSCCLLFHDQLSLSGYSPSPKPTLKNLFDFILTLELLLLPSAINFYIFFVSLFNPPWLPRLPRGVVSWACLVPVPVEVLEVLSGCVNARLGPTVRPSATCSTSHNLCRRQLFIIFNYSFITSYYLYLFVLWFIVGLFCLKYYWCLFSLREGTYAEWRGGDEGTILKYYGAITTDYRGGGSSGASQVDHASQPLCGATVTHNPYPFP